MTETITRKEVAAAVAKRIGISKAKANDAVGAALLELTQAFKAEKRVMLKGFGVFRVKMMAARQGRNPQTGERVDIPAAKKVIFRVSKKPLVARKGRKRAK